MISHKNHGFSNGVGVSNQILILNLLLLVSFLQNMKQVIVMIARKSGINFDGIINT